MLATETVPGPLHPTHPADMADPRGRPWACQTPEADRDGHWSLRCDGCYIALVAAAKARPERVAKSTKDRRLPIRLVLAEANRLRARLGMWTVGGDGGVDDGDG